MCIVISVVSPHQASFSDFRSPESALDNLLLAVRNMLAQYRKTETRFDLDPDEKQLKNMCGHRLEFGSNYSQLHSRFNSQLRDTPYEAQVDSRLKTDDLEEILTTDTASLPIVEVHPDYYSTVEDEYSVQAGQFQERTNPILLPVGIEEDFIIYWDPFYDYFNDAQNESTEMTLRETLFFEYWSRTDRTRWSVWIDRGDQDTLSQFTEEQK